MDWPELTPEQLRELRDVVKRVKKFESRQSLGQILELSPRDSVRNDRNSGVRRSDGAPTAKEDWIKAEPAADPDSFRRDLPPIVQSSVRDLKSVKGKLSKIIVPRSKAKHSSVVNSPDRSPATFLSPVRAESPILTRHIDPIRLPLRSSYASKPSSRKSAPWARKDSHEAARGKLHSKSPSPSNSPVQTNFYSDWEIHDALKSSMKQTSFKDKRKQLVASLKSIKTYLPIIRSS
jgi:hypothetical protein